MATGLHRPLAEGVVAALRFTFTDRLPAEKSLEQVFHQHRRWGARDRRFVAAAFFDIVRWWRRYLAAVDKPWQDTFAQGLETEWYWRTLYVWLTTQSMEIPAWVEWQGLSRQDIERQLAKSVDHRATQLSIPDWLDEWGVRECGPLWERHMAHMNVVAPIFLRVNRCRVKVQEVIEHLTKEGISVEPILDMPLALQMCERKSLRQSPSFMRGEFEIQDVHSQKIAPFLRPERGERIIDACAGAGGKTLHLADLIGDKGKIIALDVSEAKLAALGRRAARAKYSCIEIRPISSQKVIKRLHGQADRVLLDVPCSGLGVLRRHPDTRWKLTAELIQQYIQTQQKILKEYAQMTRSGGSLVYSTCSIMPSENRLQVEQFLKLNLNEWQLEEELILEPTAEGGDGFYAARLRRAKVIQEVN